MSEQTSTASFIDQLEAAALGKNIPIPNPVAKHAPKSVSYTHLTLPTTPCV